MADTDYRKATEDELERSLAFALTHDGRKRFRISSEMMAKLTAAHLVKHLERSGYVILKKPPLQGHGVPMPRS